MAQPLDLDALVHAHQAEVWWYLRALGCDDSLADDLTQETFLAVMDSDFRDYDARATATYLRTIARRLYGAALGRRRRENSLPLDEASFDHVDAQWLRLQPVERADDLAELLDRCLEALDARGRRALEMRFGEELNLKAIGVGLDISEEGARKLLQRSRQTLKECIERRQG